MSSDKTDTKIDTGRLTWIQNLPYLSTVDFVFSLKWIVSQPCVKGHSPETMDIQYLFSTVYLLNITKNKYNNIILRLM